MAGEKASRDRTYSDRAFIDTNILLYAASDDPDEAEKAGMAQTLLENLVTFLQ